MGFNFGLGQQLSFPLQEGGLSLILFDVIVRLININTIDIILIEIKHFSVFLDKDFIGLPIGAHLDLLHLNLYQLMYYGY